MGPCTFGPRALKESLPGMSNVAGYQGLDSVYKIDTVFADEAGATG